MTGQARPSFLKKRSKKLLLTGGFGDGGATARRSKVFLLLFVYKKKCFLAPSLAHPRPTP
jgi:hypothetical protein